MKHTPTPWKLTTEAYGDEWWFGGASEGQAIIQDAAGDDIAVLGLCRSEEDSKQEANAEFIVLAVNSHDALLEATERLAPYVQHKPNCFKGHDRKLYVGYRCDCGLDDIRTIVKAASSPATSPRTPDSE